MISDSSTEMTNSPKKGNGAAIGFLRLLIGYKGRKCVAWPFKRLPNGYGQLGYLGQQLYAHRLMCELENGPPPSEGHIAAHSCGKGHEGCINPSHLGWKTYSENELDKRVHGTKVKQTWGWKGKLSPEQVDEIRSLKGMMTQAAIASRFNISEPTIRDIFLGRSHRPQNLNKRVWLFAEEEKLTEYFRQGLGLDEMAARLNRTQGAVRACAYRKGLFGKTSNAGQTQHE